MNSTNGALDFQARIDIEQLRRDIENMKSEFRGVTRTVSKEGQKTQEIINSMLKGAGAIFTIQKAREFAGEIFRVRSEFQALQVSFETMLGSKAKADALMSQVVEFASKTPFQLSEVAGGTKSLLAYRIEQEKIIPTLKALGDVSAGLNVPIQRLILNYGQVKTATKLTGRELRDFNMAGVPLIAELSKNLNKSQNDINAMVSAGKIGFKEVEEAFRTMSSEGGQFANLMDKQSQTLQGRYSNLQDNIEKMFNELGKSSEGAFNSALDGAGYLVEHYQEIGKEIGGLVVAYGSYKTAIMVASVIQGIATQSAMGYTLAQQVQYNWLLLVEKAQKRLNATMLKNPYVLVGVAVAGLGYAFYKMITAQTGAEKATENLNNRLKEQKEYVENEQNEVSNLIDTIKDETSTRTEKQLALDKLQAKYPKINEKRTRLSDKEQIKKNKADLKDAERYYNLAIKSGSYASMNKYAKEIERLKTENKGLEDKILKEDLAKEKADFNAKPNDEKIRIKTEENQQLKNEIAELEKQQQENKSNYLGADPYKETQLRIAKQKLQENEKNITKWQEKGNKIVSDKIALTKELRALNKDIAKLEKINQKTAEQTKSLEDKNARKKEIEKQLKKDFGYSPKKSTKTEKPTFDYEKNARDNKRKLQDLANQKAQSEINAMRDVAEKTLAQLELDGKLKLQAIQRQKENEIQRIKDAEKKKAEFEGRKYDTTKDSPRVKETKKVFKNIELEVEIQNKNDKKKYYEDQLKEQAEFIETYIQKAQELEEKKQELKNKGYSDDVISNVTEDDQKELTSLEEQIQGGEEYISTLVNELINMGISEVLTQLNEAKAILNEELKRGGTDKAKIKLLKNKIKTYKTALKQKTLKNSKAPDNNNWRETIKVLNDVNSTAEKAINGFDGLSDGAKKAFGVLFTVSSGAVSIISTIQGVTTGAVMGVQATASAGKSAIRSVENASVILAIISVALQVIQKITSLITGSNKARKEALEKIRKNEIAQQREYNKLLFEQNLLMKDMMNIFSEDKLGKALKAIDLLKNKTEEFKGKLAKNKEEDSFSFLGGNLGLIKKKVSELDQIQVKTGWRKTGFLGWGSGEATYTSITEKYGKLIKANGELDIQLAKSILNNKEFAGDGKENLQEIITLYEQMEKANKELDNYLKSTFGELGKGMMDSVINSLKNGEDAFESFQKSISNVMLKLGKDLVINATLQPILKRMSDDLRKKTIEARNAGKSTDQIAKVMSVTIKGYMWELKSGMESAKAGLKVWQEQVKNDFKVDIFDDAQRQASKKGFAQMSQDTGKALDGKFTLSIELQRQHLNIAKEVSTSFKYLQDTSAKYLKHLVGIETNTATLHQMKADINVVKSGIQDINDKGIKIKR